MATSFPFGLAGVISSLQNASGNPVRLNARNDQTYTLTAGLNFGALGASVLQGYSSAPGDLGKATFTSSITSATNFTLTGSSTQNFIDLVFTNTGASNANHLFSVGNSVVFLRCVFHGARGSGLLLSSGGTPTFVIECESYDCNKSNTANDAGFATVSSTLICVNCYSHDHSSGANGNGFSSISTTASMILMNCIAESNGGAGVAWGASISAAGTGFSSINCDYYNNVDGIKFTNTTAGAFAYIANNNFVKNSGKAINNPLALQAGIIYNNGRGSGTQANGSGDALGGIVDSGTDVTYASNVTPWNAPTTGDFRITLAAAQAAGRGAFTETDGTNTGTVGYPDIGSAQANAITQSPAWAGGDFILPAGYIGHAYLYEWAFSSNATFALQSGSLPPGLTITPVSTNGAEIVGSPTTIGTYNFVLRVTVGTSTGDATFHITINADPDEGIGGLLGGLRPTC